MKNIRNNNNFHLHHIGYLVSDIAAESHKFQSILDYTADSEVIIDDTQTAKVQLLKQIHNNFWIELITPISNDSKIYKSLNKGIVLHHLCYEVLDYEKSIIKLKNKGYFQITNSEFSVAFSQRRITWFMGEDNSLIEILEYEKCNFNVIN